MKEQIDYLMGHFHCHGNLAKAVPEYDWRNSSEKKPKPGGDDKYPALRVKSI